MPVGDYRQETVRLKGIIETLRTEITARDREIEAMRDLGDSMLQNMALMKDFQTSILSSMAEGIFTIDKSGNVTSFNESAQRITGFESNDIIGRKYKHLLPFADDFPVGKVSEEGPVFYETGILNTHNQTISAILCLAPLKNVKGKIVGTMVVFQDVTELKGLREQMIRSERLALMGRLAASIAHEINNPMSGILTYVRLLHKKMDKRFEHPDRNEMKKYLTIIESETNRCTTILRNLLDFARPARPEIRHVDIEQVLDQSIALLHDPLRQKNIKLRKNIAPSLPKVKVDFGQLQQVFMNIIVNACEAVVDEGRLEISITPENGFVIVAISDTGCGIPEEEITKIFDPFFTTKVDEEDRGLGLGLSIAHTIVKEHGGYIEVRSKVGSGTTFTIGLPTE